MDMTDALLPPQLSLMLVMVLTQALAGSALIMLGAWNAMSSCGKIAFSSDVHQLTIGPAGR